MTSPDLVVNRIPLAIREAIALRNRRLVIMHEIDHPQGYVRAYTADGPMTFEGETWYGVGSLIGFSGLGGSRATKVRNLTIILGAVRADQLQFINEKVRGRLAKISMAALKPGRREVDGPRHVLGVAKCDFQDHKIGRDRMATIEIGAIQPVKIMDRAPNLAWTPDWLKATYGDDIVGLDDLPGTAARDVSWAPP